MVHAFPDAGTDSAVLIRCILANGAKAVGDSELRRMLKNEKHASYAKRLGSIVCVFCVFSVIDWQNCSLATSTFVAVPQQGEEDDRQHGSQLLRSHSR